MAKQTKKDETIVDVEEVYSKTEKFLDENQKPIYIALGVILAAVALYFGWNKLYIAPKVEEAQTQMFKAERYFEKDSFRLALEGDAEYPGFLEIADDYGMTAPGNLANYYAGICYLRLGSFEDAIDYLENFDGDDRLISQLAEGAIGDAHMELGDYEEALSSYLDAANDDPSDYSPIFLMKAGLAAEKSGDYEEAVDIYTELEEKYPTSQEAKNAPKYIARVNQLAKQ